MANVQRGSGAPKRSMTTQRKGQLIANSLQGLQNDAEARPDCTNLHCGYIKGASQSWIVLLTIEAIQRLFWGEMLA